MKGPFFTAPRLPWLEQAAAGWVGTPWRAHSNKRGVGAACHFAVAGVLCDAGFDPGEVPDGASNWSRHQKHSLQQAWLDASPVFETLADLDLRPGDVIGFQVGQCVHHLGLILTNDRYFICLDPHGAIITPCSGRSYHERIRAAWRPVEERGSHGR